MFWRQCQRNAEHAKHTPFRSVIADEICAAFLEIGFKINVILEWIKFAKIYKPNPKQTTSLYLSKQQKLWILNNKRFFFAFIFNIFFFSVALVHIRTHETHVWPYRVCSLKLTSPNGSSKMNYDLFIFIVGVVLLLLLAAVASASAIILAIPLQQIKMRKLINAI